MAERPSGTARLRCRSWPPSSSLSHRADPGHPFRSSVQSRPPHSQAEGVSAASTNRPFPAAPSQADFPGACPAPPQAHCRRPCEPPTGCRGRVRHAISSSSPPRPNGMNSTDRPARAGSMLQRNRNWPGSAFRRRRAGMWTARGRPRASAKRTRGSLQGNLFRARRTGNGQHSDGRRSVRRYESWMIWILFRVEPGESIFRVALH